MKRTTLQKVSEKQSEKIKIRQYWKPIILKRQRDVCAECKMREDWRGWELSHRIPLSRGGTDTPDNYEVLCAKCHATKRHGIREV